MVVHNIYMYTISSEGRCHVRQIWVSKIGSADVLEVREADKPEPAAGELELRVRAAGVSFADVLIRQGLLPHGPKLPCVIGWEVAGEVETGGHGFEKGDRVFAVTD